MEFMLLWEYQGMIEWMWPLWTKSLSKIKILKNFLSQILTNNKNNLNNDGTDMAFLNLSP